MANKIKSAKNRVHKNDRSRFERIVRHRQALEREKYIEKALARSCNIYFICFFLAVFLAIGTTIWVFISPAQNIMVLGLNVAIGLVFAPLCLYQHNQYHHMAEEVAKARQSAGFRFPEDYTPRTRKTREMIARPASQYSTMTFSYGAGVVVVAGITIYQFSTNTINMSLIPSLLFVLAAIVVGIILFVLFLSNLLNYIDAKSLIKSLVKIGYDTEAEFAQQLQKHAPKQVSEETSHVEKVAEVVENIEDKTVRQLEVAKDEQE